MAPQMVAQSVGKPGVPQRGVISPLLSNLYLNEVDRMLERANEVTRYQLWTAVEYARFADDLVMLVDSHARQRAAVEKPSLLEFRTVLLRNVLGGLHQNGGRAHFYLALTMADWMLDVD
jgi:retron-type reverse transcriptase